MDMIKKILERLAYNNTGFKALFVLMCTGVLMLHDFTPENALVFERLIEFVLGAKAAQYIAQAYMKGKSAPNDESV